ncbi:tetratricopeptide (TPR) repeat protein [Nocardiopsis mwathae]|uniref:Tetratricopeptide (TPR) repeat protein n=1 Tax=Nocardiopsis mwathae TaxID=1472723 RepID=A0A7W9YHV7_9ACTN|nr:tetratricopeptide (TPR) repeat protein [Nocardiopsis mwathae]
MTGSRGRDRPEAEGSAAVPSPGEPFPRSGAAAPAWWEVGDALWLAAHRDRARDPTGGESRPPAAEPGDRAGTEPQADADGTPASSPDRAPPEHRDEDDIGQPAEPPLPPECHAQAEAVPESSGIRGGGSAAPPPGDPVAIAPLGSGGPPIADRMAMVRALQWFRRHRPAGDRTVLDEDATAAGFAERALAHRAARRTRRAPLLPVLRPEQEVADGITVLVDDSLSMLVQQPLVHRFVDLLAPLNVFRRVRVCYFDSGKAQADDLPLRAAEGPAPAPERLVDGGSADSRILLVVTDGIGDGWHSGAVGTWLARWGTRGPVGVAQVLDRRLWRSTGMAPEHVRLEAPSVSGGAPVPNSTYAARPFSAWPPATADATAPDGTVPVPVFPLEPAELGRWARFVARRRNPPVYPVAALLTTREPTVAGEIDEPGGIDEPGTSWDIGALLAPWDLEPDFTRDLDARRRVQMFQAIASPSAFRLAVHLAVVPLNLSTIRLIQERFAPRARPSDVTEVLCSGLIRRSPGSPSIDRGDRVTLEFRPDVRELLLAVGGQRHEIRELLTAIAGHYRDTIPWFAALERLLLGDAPGVPLPEVTGDTAPFARAVRAAMLALPGPIRLAADPLVPADRPEAVPGMADSGHSDSGYDDAGRERLKGSDVNLDVFPPTGSPAVTRRAGSAPPVPDGDSMHIAQQAVPRGQHTRPAVWGQIPPRNMSFVGREPLLAELGRRLQEGTAMVLPQTVPQALQGMGGVGKTQLATEYAWRHRGEYDLVWWIPSDTPAQVQQSLIELAPKLGIGTGGDPAATVRTVLEALRSGRPVGDWLLIYDNAVSPADIRPLIPSGGPGHVVVTSRSPEWRTAGGYLLQVDTFERDESTELLLKRGPESLAPEEADRIAERLGDLPLAVEQTAVWLYETLMPAEEWLELFDVKADQLLSNVAPSPDYPWSVAATMNMTLERLRESNPGALQLLQVCAFLAPQPIPRRLFNGARNVEAPEYLAEILADPAIKLGRALRTIDRYALAKMDHRNTTFQLHRLVQETLKLPLDAGERDRFRHCAHLLLANLDPGDPLAPGDWPRYVELLPHVWETRQWDCGSDWARELALNEVHFLFQWGRLAEAEALVRRLLDQWPEKLGPEDPHTLRAEMRYAQVATSAGRFEEAYERRKGLVETLIRLRGPDDEETLETRGLLALDLRNLGQYQRAVKVSSDVLDRQQRAFGRDDPLTLQSAHVHAVGLRLIGRFNESMEINQYNYQRRGEMLGPEHVQTLASRSAHAQGLMESGRYWEAEREMDELYLTTQRVFPADHTMRLSTMMALSALKRRTGRLPDALALSGEAYELLQGKLGVGAAETNRAAANHAVSLRAKGEHETALALSREARDRYRASYGAEHPLYAATSVNHAVTLRLLGRLEEARRVDEEALAVNTDRLGEDHPATLANSVNLASDLFAAGNAAAALEMDATTLERTHRILGEDHPLALAVRRNWVLDRMVVEDTALTDERSAVVERYRTMFGPAHPATRSAEEDVRANCDLFLPLL